MVIQLVYLSGVAALYSFGFSGKGSTKTDMVCSMRGQKAYLEKLLIVKCCFWIFPKAIFGLAETTSECQLTRGHTSPLPWCSALNTS